MQFVEILLTSVLSLIQVFSQENLAMDIQKTFSNSTNTANYFLPSTLTNQVFDFIVVGAGSAGSIVASRLAENGKFTVALFDLGGDPPPSTFVPLMAEAYGFSPHISFQYKASIDASSGREGDVTQGKVLGGTGVLNLMIFNRGSPSDYDNWANLTDNSWSYTNVLPFFKNMENYTGAFPNDDHHGTDGPVTVCSQSYAPGLSTFLEAGIELGYPTLDPNGPQRKCFAPFEYNKKNGRRHSSYTAHIGSKEANPNLTVISHANVIQITFDQANQVTGIVYTKHGVTFIAKAKNEVVVSAGTFGSPQLLLRSGIGPADHLSELNIPLISDLPVGQNVHDHVFVPLKFTLEDTAGIHHPQIDITESSTNEFLEMGTGPLSSDLGLSAQAFMVSSIAEMEGHPQWPDIQLTYYAQNLDFPYPTPEEDRLKAVAVAVQLGRVKSRGSIQLEVGTLIPRISYNVLSDNRDGQVLLEGIKKTLEIFEETNAYKGLGAKFPKPVIQLCDEFDYQSDQYWNCYIGHFVQPNNHQVGSCRMGREDDSGAVVDPKLRVKGVTGLRVIDASVMPTVTNANIQGAIFLIAEKGVADILADY